MTHITRFTFSRSSRPAIRALASPEVLHAIIAHATEQTAPSTTGQDPRRSPEGRTLWRLDPGHERHRLFIVSPQRPDEQVLRAELGEASTFESLDYRPLLDALHPGQEWCFRLKANPTKAVSQAHGQRGKRAGIVRAAEQVEWLTARAEQLGVSFPVNRFGLPEVVVRDTATIGFRRHESTVSLATAVLDGFLTVVDPNRLRAALLEGVGRAKGYGYGLLTLAKPDTVPAAATPRPGSTTTTAGHHG